MESPFRRIIKTSQNESPKPPQPHLIALTMEAVASRLEAIPIKVSFFFSLFVSSACPSHPPLSSPRCSRAQVPAPTGGASSRTEVIGSTPTQTCNRTAARTNGARATSPPSVPPRWAVRVDSPPRVGPWYNPHAAALGEEREEIQS